MSPSVAPEGWAPTADVTALVGAVDVQGPWGMSPGGLSPTMYPELRVDEYRTAMWSTDPRSCSYPLTVVAPRDGRYLIYARPLLPGVPSLYTITFRLHPWNNVTAPPWPVAGP